MIVSCTKCAVKLKVDEGKVKPGGSKLKCPKCENIFMVFRPEEQGAPQPAQAAPPPPAPPVQAPPAPQPPVQQAPAPAPEGPKWELNRRKVVIGHSGDSTLELMVRMLNQSGFEAIGVKDGVEAMMQLEKHRPGVAIFDVALPSIFGFELCDRLKNNSRSSDIKVILIASIYDKTKYKRAPTSLYGADDYLEKHHIEDVLVKKVNRLLSPAGSQPLAREEETVPPPPPEMAAVREQHAEEMRREEIPQIQQPSGVDTKQAEAARRFARIILSDIALYNQAAVEEGIRNGNFEQALSEELKEGRELYNSRVPAEVRQSMDYFAEEVVNFVEKKKHIMEMGG